MIILNASNDSLEIVTSAAGKIEYVIAYADHTSSGVSISNALGTITTATTTTVVSAPAAGTTRQIRGIMIANTSASTNNTLTVQIDTSGTNKKVMSFLLEYGENAQYTDGAGWKTISRLGSDRTLSYEFIPMTYSLPIYKVGTATEAGGIYHSFHDSSGTPGAWSPGSPGLAGRATFGTEAADAGCLYIRTPTSGSATYVQAFMTSTNRANTTFLFDYVWVNTGINVTTTTAQTINSVKFPPRDYNGSSDGVGYEVGILVTSQTGNLAAITNTTMSYTNSEGVSGRTAAIQSFPITAVAGTIVPFGLQQGDRGIRSIQSVTLGTSYVSGAISIIVGRRLAFAGTATINIPSTSFIDKTTNQLWPGTCAIVAQAPSVNTAATIQGVVTITEK